MDHPKAVSFYSGRIIDCCANPEGHLALFLLPSDTIPVLRELQHQSPEILIFMSSAYSQIINAERIGVDEYSEIKYVPGND